MKIKDEIVILNMSYISLDCSEKFKQNYIRDYTPPCRYNTIVREVRACVSVCLHSSSGNGTKFVAFFLGLPVFLRNENIEFLRFSLHPVGLALLPPL